MSELATHSTTLGAETVVFLPFILSRRKEAVQFLDPLQDTRTPLCQRDELTHPLPRAEELAHFFKQTAETLGRSKISKPQHRVIAVLDSTMILLDRIGPAANLAMHDLRSQDLSDGPGVRRMTLGDDPLRRPCYGSVLKLDIVYLSLK